MQLTKKHWHQQCGSQNNQNRASSFHGTNPVMFVSAKVRDLCRPIIAGLIMSLDVPDEVFNDTCSGLYLNIEMI